MKYRPIFFSTLAVFLLSAVFTLFMPACGMQAEPEFPIFAALTLALATLCVLLALPSSMIKAEADGVDFVVNDRGELGVRVGDQLLWFFRGRTRPFVYGYHSAGGDRMHWRRCTSAEFGDRIMVPGHVFGDRYTHGDGWQLMPAHKLLTTTVKRV